MWEDMRKKVQWRRVFSDVSLVIDAHPTLNLLVWE